MDDKKTFLTTNVMLLSPPFGIGIVTRNSDGSCAQMSQTTDLSGVHGFYTSSKQDAPLMKCQKIGLTTMNIQLCKPTPYGFILRNTSNRRATARIRMMIANDFFEEGFIINPNEQWIACNPKGKPGFLFISNKSGKAVDLQHRPSAVDGTITITCYLEKIRASQTHNYDFPKYIGHSLIHQDEILTDLDGGRQTRSLEASWNAPLSTPSTETLLLEETPSFRSLSVDLDTTSSRKQKNTQTFESIISDSKKINIDIGKTNTDKAITKFEGQMHTQLFEVAEEIQWDDSSQVTFTFNVYMSKS